MRGVYNLTQAVTTFENPPNPSRNSLRTRGVIYIQSSWGRYD